MSLQIRHLSYSLGAEIIGVDIRGSLDDKDFAAIHAAFLDYSVLLFRGQPITQEQHMEFTRRFGEIESQSGMIQYKDPKYRDILMHKAPPAATQVWHSDRSFTCVPTMASLFRAVDIPEVGGDTMFSNLYLAYETLSNGLKRLIEGLHGIHPGPKSRLDDSTPERLAETKRFNPPVAQPLVRVHPETGRKSLFLEEKVSQLAGMTVEESKPIIRYLCEHAARPQFVYRHAWQKHDLVVWDNRCTNHMAVGDYDRTQARHMERTSVVGTPSGHVYDGPLEVSHF